MVEEKWKRSGTTSFYHKCVKRLPENILAELQNTELLVDRKSETGHDVRYSMACMGIIFIGLLFLMCRQLGPELGK